ncbi:Protein phosphatase PTC7 [Actinomortierella wolfii]|nr:Protein phosphatase PTC7 [Actinomortierella wolfii]
MLARTAARPFGLSPSRLVATFSAAATHRIAHWIARPLTLVHMHRYLHLAPQLLITADTTSPSSSSPSTSSSSSSSSASSTGGSTAGLHTSSTASQQQQQQQQQQQETSANTSTNAGFGATSPPPPTSSQTHSYPNSVPASSPIAFNYLLAASWHPKMRHRRTPSRPKSEEERTEWWKQKLRAGKVDAGEDAFFHVSTPNRVALGVADGVGGWSEVGVDPALFSWALMDNAEAVARLTDTVSDKDEEIKVLDAQSILDGAYTALIKSGKIEAGSSTACILSLCKRTGILKASNLGDSAYLLIRDNKCLYESPSQQHFWNCPYQLTVLPPGYPRGSGYVQDLPKDAAQTTHQLQDGDVIVLATDGFWDNVFTQEAIELVDRELGDIINKNKGGENMPVEDVVARVRTLSQRLTNTARRFSLDAKRRTPFSQSARHIRSGG